ncbi:hypothetical protein NP92_07400 [Anoxybacillus gonensis]|uniref:Negative regulator of flagellin synthesis n=1 Tax=Anoxybacillus gonensis TaxID=198467 RepID=A0AAW7TIQ0_9BACL|nr:MULTISPECIES: flagellar biosynthesis anti-sigma factor FlgM [Anoxybacillus]AXM89148.1 flagellar biosynthesis anti-sigma factor FlgM [Anoxybacillus ayderensis G10]THD17763.1 flagellar biosynthesis anti-sigma factor FlgM [Anoxybacillus ayderensis]AKS39509.1 hypothetical protein AFK25_13255 [Anoxybacillus gonensis]KGP60606.1 hypothetical protein NP92_07400 [Anoxybacillus gonensis]MBW9218586.1 flagellar biosynthesis anti-sigma factor FlgM [Anoxybacillus sp. ST70]
MRIDHVRLSNVYAYRSRIESDVSKHKRLKENDQVDISVEAKELQQLALWEKERQKKLADIKERVQNGTYQIDNYEVAKSIYAFYKQGKQ